MNPLEESKNKLFRGLFILTFFLTAFFAVKILAEIKQVNMLGESGQPATIAFSGHGEVTAVPDIASVYFTISKDAKTVKEAQASVAVVEKSALDFLKAQGIADKDIKTAEASFNPKYENRKGICSPLILGDGSTVMPDFNCGNYNQVIIGYTASESITVKIRKTDNVGAVMQGLGTVGVSNLNGPNFSIDNEDALKAQARKKAIDDAKAKAEVLAKDLGVKLVKITSFNEGGGGYPIMYAKGMMADSVSSAPAPAQIPKGENTISSDVTITYEIR